MDTYLLNDDIKVFCITASSFPEGLPTAYGKLHSLYPPENGRSYYGISYPDGKGGLVYKAAVRLADIDGTPPEEFEPHTIKKGTYLSKIIRNFMADTPAIRQTFQEMIKSPDIDPNGYCLEMYLNPDDVRCMVKLK